MDNLSPVNLSTTAITADGPAAPGLSEAAVTWIENRGLDAEAAVKAGWHSSPSDELVIPYFRGVDVVNRKYRSLTEKRFRQDKGGEKCFLNFDALLGCEGQPVVICEGEMDWLAFQMAGYPFTVSVPDGAPNQALGSDYDGSKYDYLTPEARKLIRKASHVILATDGDKNGDNLAKDLAFWVGRSRCKIITYPRRHMDSPERLKDANEVLQVYGIEGLRKTVNNAKWCAFEGFRGLMDIADLQQGAVFETGVDGFSDLFKIRLGDFSVWTGVPGSGKTTFLNHLICSTVTRNEWRAGWMSFEQHPRRDHHPALRSWYLRQPAHQASEKERAKADQWIDRHFCFVDPAGQEPRDISWVIDTIEAGVIRQDIKIAIIDPWNELEHTRGRNESLTEYVGRSIVALKRCAMDCGIHLAIVAHPAKYEGDKAPGLYHISDSAHWANKCDLGVVVHREPESTQTQVAVRKARYEDIGKPGKRNFNFNSYTRRFEYIDPAFREHTDCRS